MAGEDLAGMISRVSLGDRAAFSALYSATSPKLFSVCLRILKDRTDAEDALQEIFVKIWHRADRFASSGINPLGWLMAIARNHSIDLLRARKPVASNIDEEGWDIADSGADPEQAAVLKGEGKRIDTCMEELESDRAGAVRSAYVEGLSYQELADRHAVPLNTMRTWLRRSLLKLRECLDR
ncbi:sigma-70 family RNA polymerase sigma factor [Rhizobiales bacterium RZME27]|uniref:Sigma-70 family RNA polymerase sigma factor n=1 Tax=Endobacterium cereale TaxID=2663029 RepID=A0A6A8A5Z2_9HYPH|nr:sigma-70 family RNA polymerase sigma factor [Endobacterium cereale]MEB2844759.1 sigma-70 family RNA polymerase sigma factor [Endobacterium cereale]MQY44676.1 sigma-70 family RNA polymerase sigma factor [Endobacterium cereale]